MEVAPALEISEQEASSQLPVNNLSAVVGAMVDASVMLARWVEVANGNGPILLGQGRG